jgi:tRNA(Ile)-lysidine synthase
MALLHVLARTRDRHDFALFAHGVDHGLRAEAGGELDLAEGLAKKLDVPFFRSSLRVPSGGNLQARARTARWRALASFARERDAAVATAHHADDRAETFLMRILRGSGVRGLAVLPPRAKAPGAADVVVLRPLLRARRSDIMAHLERHAVPYATDPSNVDPRYLRTRVRTRLLPVLVELDPGIVGHLNALADELVGDERAAAEADVPEDAAADWTRALPRPTQVALTALLRSRSQSARVWLPGGLVAAIAPSAGRAPRARRASSSAAAAPLQTRLPEEKPNC